MFGKLAELLTRQTEVAGQPFIQPTNATVGNAAFELKHIANEAFLPNGTTDALLLTSPTGWTVPDPIILNGLPTTPVITGTADVRTTDAPKGKGCN